MPSMHRHSAAPPAKKRHLDDSAFIWRPRRVNKHDSLALLTLQTDSRLTTMPRARERHPIAATPLKTPLKSVQPSPRPSLQLTSPRIPLNDDRQEKANRLHSRQALHEAQLNSIKAAATPARRALFVGGSPRTPADGPDGLDSGMPSVGGAGVTPMKRVPILANFEEWMKLATDNVCVSRGPVAPCLP